MDEKSDLHCARGRVGGACRGSDLRREAQQTAKSSSFSLQTLPLATLLKPKVSPEATNPCVQKWISAWPGREKSNRRHFQFPKSTGHDHRSITRFGQFSDTLAHIRLGANMRLCAEPLQEIRKESASCLQ